MQIWAKCCIFLLKSLACPCLCNVLYEFFQLDMELPIETKFIVSHSHSPLCIEYVHSHNALCVCVVCVLLSSITIKIGTDLGHVV